MKSLQHAAKVFCLSTTSVLLFACATGSHSYSANTPQAKSAKLLDQHQMEVASIVALSLVYYCKHDKWPPKNTLTSRDRKLSRSFARLTNNTNKNGTYQMRFKFKLPANSGLDIAHNPEWIVSIPHTPSSAWSKGPIYVPVTVEGSTAGQRLNNIDSSQRFKAECKPYSAWAGWSPENNDFADMA